MVTLPAGINPFYLKFTKIMKENGEFNAEMIEDCKNIAEELVDALKIAINFDNQAHQGHLQFVYKDQTILARQLITRLDEKIEEIRFKSKGLLVVLCQNWEACKYIAHNYQKVKFKDKEVHYDLFCDRDPIV